MTSRRYDRNRGRRYKEWWSRQSGPPQGELIRVPDEMWVNRPQITPAAPQSPQIVGHPKKKKSSR